jgi:hypothetical protein
MDDRLRVEGTGGTLMLIAPSADSGSVIHRLLVTLSWVCCLVVLASFALFAHDQLAGASKHQQNELAGNVAPAAVPPTPHVKKQPRRFIDGAASTLTSPFDSVIQSHNAWADHGVPTVIALVAYGLGLGFLARFTRDRA